MLSHRNRMHILPLASLGQVMVGSSKKQLEQIELAQVAKVVHHAKIELKSHTSRMHPLQQDA